MGGGVSIWGKKQLLKYSLEASKKASLILRAQARQLSFVGEH